MVVGSSRARSAFTPLSFQLLEICANRFGDVAHKNLPQSCKTRGQINWSKLYLCKGLIWPQTNLELMNLSLLSTLSRFSSLVSNEWSEPLDNKWKWVWLRTKKMERSIHLREEMWLSSPICTWRCSSIVWPVSLCDLLYNYYWHWIWIDFALLWALD